MISINEHIRYLLTRVDCVVVPGLGAFIARTESARYEESTGLFMPPTRRMSFNALVRHDDGVLAHSLVRREGVAYETARTLIANEVAMLRSRLDSCGMAMLPRLGTLTRTEGSLLFTPADSAPLVASRYLGLAPVSVGLSGAIASQPVEEEQSDLPILDVAPRRSLRWMRVAASVAALVGLGFALSTPVLVDRSGLNYASVGTTAIKPMHKVRLAEPATATEARTLFCAIPDTADATARYVKAIATPAPVKSPAAKASPQRAYSHYLIVASCETRRRADRFVSSHAADNLRVLEADGRYRVYIKAADNEADVQAPRASVALRYPGAWVYSR